MKPLTERDHDILASLAAYQASAYLWQKQHARPMDLGAWNGSHHSATLNKLVRRGLVARSRPPVAGRKGSQRYWLTEAGARVAAEEKATFLASLQVDRRSKPMLCVVCHEDDPSAWLSSARPM